MNLYKYMDENRIKNILVDNKIRFTQPIYFNDPFEVKLSIEGIATETDLIRFEKDSFNNIVRELYNEQPKLFRDKINLENFFSIIDKDMIMKEFRNIVKNENYISTIKKTFDNVINKVFGVLSLTTKNNNLLMWAHYADNHKGFVVEFNGKNEFFEPENSDNYIYNGLQKVEYSRIRPYSFLNDSKWEELLLIKSEEWSYEDEYRIFRRLNEADEVIGNIHLFEFSKEMIKSIYCGCNMSKENVKEIIQLISEEKELSHIKVYKAKVSKKYYELEFEKIK